MLRNEPVFFARSVKFLCLGDFSNGEFYMAALCLQPTFERQKELVQTVLNTCSGVTRLAVWLSVDAHTFQRAFTSGVHGSRHLTHLSLIDVVPDSLFVHDHLEYLRASLTHLHLDTDTVGPFLQEIPWDVFTELPHLSHICLSGGIASMPLRQPDLVSPFVARVAALPHNITTFVLLVDSYRSSNRSSFRLAPLQMVSSRLVVISCNSSYLGLIPRLHCFPEDHTIESDWGYRCGMDTWDFADLCLAKQNQRLR